eukprot:13804097-Alexandrium_andersonii.AAC.1
MHLHRSSEELNPLPPTVLPPSWGEHREESCRAEPPGHARPPIVVSHRVGRAWRPSVFGPERSI